MHVFIIGAGAVGQVYGAALARSGATVGVLVRSHHIESLKNGVTLYRKSSRRKWSPLQWKPDQVTTEFEDLACADEVWVCTSEAALTDAFMEKIRRHAKDALIVSFQPGLATESRFKRYFPPERYCFGAIGMVSYPAPLTPLHERSPIERPPKPGVAFCFPMGSQSLFSGTNAAAIAKRLTHGGCPAKADKRAQEFLAFSSALLQPVVVGLEGNGFRFSRFSRSPLLATSARAGKEALAVSGALLKSKPPFLSRLVGPWLIRIALRLCRLPFVLPFDAESYFALHFSKVGDQTRRLLPQYIHEAKRLNLDHTALCALRDTVFGSSDSLQDADSTATPKN